MPVNVKIRSLEKAAWLYHRQQTVKSSVVNDLLAPKGPQLTLFLCRAQPQKGFLKKWLVVGREIQKVENPWV